MIPITPSPQPLVMTAQQLHTAWPQATAANIQRYLSPLIATMQRHNISTPLRRAHFLAQLGWESGQGAYMHEIASGAAYEWRKDLGNIHPGDGVKYRGEGGIEVTGLLGFQLFQEYIATRPEFTGIDVIAHPELVGNDPRLWAESAGWFWDEHGLNALADQDKVNAITRIVNGGYNGLSGRIACLGNCKSALGCAA